MANNFLDKIIEHKQKVNKDKELYYASIKDQLLKNEYSRYSIFKKQISQEGKINLIAEIKKASPSRGVIREDFDVVDIVRIYSEGQAKAVSILTEDKYFLGKVDYVKKISERYNLPVLAKDFFIDEGQIFEARLNGASAILLIAAILDDKTIKRFIDIATSLDLDCLVETHKEEEVKRAIDCGTEIVGVNNRNLETFEVSLETSEELIPMIPKDKVIVAESGIKTSEDVSLLKNLGANAVLIGETFMRENNIGSKIKELMGE